MKRLLLSILLTLAFLGPSLAAPTKEQNLSKEDTARISRSVSLNEEGVGAAREKQYEKAEKLFLESLHIDAKNLTAAFNLAGIYVTNKREDAAVKLLTEYTREFPLDVGLWARLGDAYFGQKNLQEATKTYAKAYSLDPKYPGLTPRYGTALSLQGKLQEAVQVFEAAIKLDPKNAQLHSNLSTLYLALSKPQQSISSAKQALQIKPAPDVYITLGNAYQILGDYKNSLISFQRAKDLGSTDPELESKIALIEKRAVQ